MTSREIVQGLLFILHDKKIEDMRDYHFRSQHESPNGGFLLLPPAAQTEKIVSLFSKHSISVLTKDQEFSVLNSAVKEKTVDVAEILLKTSELPRGFTQFSFRVFTDESNETTLRRAITRDFDIRRETSELKRSFKWTTRSDSATILESILSCGADIYLRHSEEGFLLHLAVSRDDEVLTQLLLKNGANVHAITNMGRTALNIAADFGHARMVTLFLQHGISVDVREKNGSTPLHIAARRGHAEVCAILLEHGAAVNPYTCFKGGTPLLLGIDSGRADVVSLLLEHGADINTAGYFGESCLQVAVDNNCVEVINLLLDHGGVTAADPRNRSAFRAAIRKGSEKLKPIIDRMVDNGFAVEAKDAHDPALLHGAVRLNCFSILEELLKQGADVNAIASGEQSRKTLLHTAVENSTDDVVQLLLRHGANVNAECSLGRTPLFHVAMSGNLSLTKELINAGASLRTHDCKSETVLSCTCVYNLPEMAELLLKNGANVNDKAPIVAATRLGLVKVVQVLCYFGANVDARNECNRTALHEAAKGNLADIADILLRNGATINIPGDPGGRTPLTEAVIERNSNVVKVLSAFGALLDSDEGTAQTVIRMSALDTYRMSWDDDTIFQFFLEYHFTDLDPTLISRCADYMEDDLRMKTKFFYNHLQKLECVGYYFGDAERRELVSNKIKFYCRPSELCIEELDRLKKLHVGDTPWTFYDVLLKGPHRVAVFARHKGFLRSLSSDFLYRHSIYGSIVEHQLKRGCERRELIEQGLKIFFCLFSEYGDFPIELAEYVLAYLSNRDIAVLVNVCTQRRRP